MRRGLLRQLFFCKGKSWQSAPFCSRVPKIRSSDLKSDQACKQSDQVTLKVIKQPMIPIKQAEK